MIPHAMVPEDLSHTFNSSFWDWCLRRHQTPHIRIDLWDFRAVLNIYVVFSVICLKQKSKVAQWNIDPNLVR